MAYLGKTPSQAVRSRYYFTASGSETSLSPTEVTGLSFTDANYVDVSLNGVALVSGTDYTATPSTNTISGLAALTASDVVEIVVYDTFSVFGGSVNGDFTISNGTLAAEAVTVTGLTTTGNINFGDNDKAVFGAGNDLEIFHNGTNSVIKDNGVGRLNLVSDGPEINLQSGTEYYIQCINNGAVRLYNNGDQKIQTTSTGIDVTGNAKLSGTGSILQFDKNGSGTDNVIYYDNSIAANNLYLGKDSSNIIYRTGGSERLRITSGGDVGIGTTSPNAKLDVEDTAGSLGSSKEDTAEFFRNDGTYGPRLQIRHSTTGTDLHHTYSTSASNLTFSLANTERMRIDSSGHVGIGVTPSSIGTGWSALQLGGNSVLFGDKAAGASKALYLAQNTFHDGTNNKYISTDEASRYRQTGGEHIWERAASGTAGTNVTFSESMRIDASGNLLVAQTSDPFPGAGNTVQGISLHNSGRIAVSSDGNTTAYLNRNTSDGIIVDFRKDGSGVGVITTASGYLAIGDDCGLLFNNANPSFTPFNAITSSNADNSIDLGVSNARFDDIFATNSTIQTSDQNEKEQIASLTTAEMTAAKAISKLFKTFKWQDKVAAKGDAARKHAGVIAQEVQTAMTDAGLDAADYAFWCSDTWTNDDGTSQTRLGIRYPELLAFVGAATEQRLADIETRLTTLENAE